MNIKKSICTLLLIVLITAAGCMPGDGDIHRGSTCGIFLGRLARMDRANLTYLGIIV